MSIDRRRTQPIMNWWCECDNPLCNGFRSCRCSRWPAPTFLDWDFDLFTAGMAKRATGVFAASPIVQGQANGAGTPDILSHVRGTLFGNPTDYCYDNFDPYQGSVVLFFTPEYDFNVGTGLHYFWYAAGNYYARYSYDLDRFTLMVGGQFIDVANNVAAGTRISVAFRWDTKNTLDGTNYGCVSLNDVHTFGIATQPTVAEPNATIYIGSDGTDEGLSGIVEALGYCRRVLFDGAYGVAAVFDASGAVDEIAAMNAPADICLTTGSWDWTYFTPTDATEEVLVTGTGEAWSHPHASNVLNRWELGDAFYGGGQWAVAFNGSNTEIDCGSGATLDDVPNGAQCTFEWWMRYDDTSAAYHTVAWKGDWDNTGWLIGVNNSDGLFAYVRLATSPADTLTSANTVPRDGKWHHYTMYYDDGAKTIHLAIDGTWGPYDHQTVGVGAYQSEAADNFIIGGVAGGLVPITGAYGWSAYWSDDHHTAGTDFIAPRTAPTAGGNLVESWHLDDGTGATATAEVTVPGNNGTITAGTWEQQWDDVLTPVYPTSLEFDGAATVVDCGSAAGLDNLPLAAILTVDGWVRWVEGNSGGDSIIGKGLFATRGWMARGFSFTVELATTDANPSFDASLLDGQWHHFAAYYADATKTGRCAVDGVWGATNVGVGAYQVDAADNLFIGRRPGSAWYLEGAASWMRLSDNDRFGAAAGTTFVPPDRVNPPAADGNTVEQWDLQDGAGTTAVAVVTTPGNDGTITMGAGRWWNTPDAENEGPGSRIYQWGYDIGSDAANDGVHQHLAGLSAGENYVARIPVRYEADKRCQPSIVAYDETNGAAISTFLGPWMTGTHDGGAAHAHLHDSTAPYWPYSLVGGTVYNITDGSSGPITACGTQITATLAGGGSNDWNNGEVYFIVPPAEWVWDEDFTFELPTIARNGAAADCAEISFRLLNSAGEGVIYWNEVELL